MIVLAGGGLAAQRCAETLRALGCEDTIVMLAAEPWAPYDRPPLSKAVLAGEAPELALRPAGWHAEHGVELRTGCAAAALDVHARIVEAGGERLRYDRLLIATGARPVSLPALAGRAGVHELRTREDAAGLARALRPGARVAVLGAGLIGQEIASAGVARGALVTLVDAAAAPFDALLGPGSGGWLERRHRQAGVELRLGRRLTGVRGGALALDDGGEVHYDHAVVAIGVRPDTAWTGRWPAGIAIDAAGRTDEPGVLAAGDCAHGGHWEAAARQGAAVARTMLGLAPAPAAPPLAWSDQHGVRIQRLGDPRDATGCELDGDPERGDFVLTYTRGGRPLAAVLVGRPGALAAVRRRLRGPGSEQEAA